MSCIYLVGLRSKINRWNIGACLSVQSSGHLRQQFGLAVALWSIVGKLLMISLSNLTCVDTMMSTIHCTLALTVTFNISCFKDKFAFRSIVGQLSMITLKLHIYVSRCEHYPFIATLSLSLTFNIFCFKVKCKFVFWSIVGELLMTYYIYSLWQDCSVGTWTNIFYLVTLTLTIGLLLEKLNLDHKFWNKRDRAFILHMFIPCQTRPICWYQYMAITFESKEI